jgi:hypothetical protein
MMIGGVSYAPVIHDGVSPNAAELITSAIAKATQAQRQDVNISE